MSQAVIGGSLCMPRIPSLRPPIQSSVVTEGWLERVAVPLGYIRIWDIKIRRIAIRIIVCHTLPLTLTLQVM